MLDNCRVPGDDRMLGEEGQGLHLRAWQSLDHGRLGIAAQAIGHWRVPHSKRRALRGGAQTVRQTNQGISGHSVQAGGHGDALTAARTLLHGRCRAKDALVNRVTRFSSMAKLFCHRNRHDGDDRSHPDFRWLWLRRPTIPSNAFSAMPKSRRSMKALRKSSVLSLRARLSWPQLPTLRRRFPDHQLITCLSLKRSPRWVMSRLCSAMTRPSGYRGIIAIHDTTLGPALRRLHAFLAIRVRTKMRSDGRACALSRGMTYKNAVAGLNLGGGKSGHHR